MNIRYFAGLVGVFLILIRCISLGAKDRVSVLSSHPHEQTVLVDDFNRYIDSVLTIPLETTDESLITHIEKILLTQEKHIVILNSTGIILFDSEGKFLFRIGNIGRAPGEYQKIYDYVWMENIC